MKEIAAILLTLLSFTPQIVTNYRRVATGVSPSVLLLGGTPSGTPRNNGDYSVGVSFVLGSPAPITKLCRWNVAGNTQSHTVFLYDNTTNSPIASVSINTLSFGSGRYACMSIASYTLLAAHNYSVLSCEQDGGDYWYDLQTYPVSTSFPAVVSSYGDSYQNGCQSPPYFTFSNGSAYGPTNIGT